GGSSPSASSSSGLPAADGKLYSGDYDGAEAAYLKLAGDGDATAMAHYALLLDYENRFPDAIALASAALNVKPSSAVQASLTRALDWSEDLPGALAAGAKAVAGSSGDPLAHAFYAEALSDGAHFPEARIQLRLAE